MSVIGSIPEGYEFIGGRNTENARQALASAIERGFPEETVLTVHDGYLVPLGDQDDVAEAASGAEDEAAATPEIDDSWKVADIDDFIDSNELDVDKSLKKSDKIDAVKAALEAKGE